MPRRRELNGVAAGIAQKFVSRYTDLDGYWALGVLYAAAVHAQFKTLTLDLLAGSSHPNLASSRELAESFHDYLYEQIAKRGFDDSQVANAIIEISFDLEPTSEQLRDKNTWGEPFLCRVILTDDLVKTHTYEVRGWCGRHDPSKELQSTRGKRAWWRFW